MFCLIMCEYCEHDTMLVHNKNCIRKSVVIKTVDGFVPKEVLMSVDVSQ